MTDYARFVAESRDALEAVRETGDWRAIPSLLYVVSHDNAAIRNAGGAAIADLAALIPMAALPGFEGLLRESTLQAYPWNEWNELRVEWVVKQEWPPRLWAMFTMHANGYVRDAALRHLTFTGDFKLALPYLLLRVNDWVSQVRTVATGAVMRLLAPEHVPSWVPVLGLVDQLRVRSRADHAWLTDGVTSLFLRAETRPALMDAAKSKDRAVARWALRAAMNLPDADRAKFIWLGIENTDPVVRLRAAAVVRVWKECPDREQLLQKMASDRFMPIRRESLYALLDGSSESHRAFLRTTLLDRHATMRHAARFYLREESGQTSDPFDARAFYLNAFATAEPSARAAAIAGLGECGSKTDADALVTFVAERRSSVAAAAVRAVASLDRDSRISWFLELLRDDRSSVAREACRALVSCGNAVPSESLREVLRGAHRDHSRQYALRVLLRRHPYDAVVDAILAAGSGSAPLVRAGSDFIERTVPWRVSYGPSDAQKAAAQRAIEGLGQPLPERLRRRLRDFMGLDVA